MHNHDEKQPQPIDIEKGYETSDVRIYLFVWGIALTFVLMIASFFVAQFIRGAFDFVPTASSIANDFQPVEEVGGVRKQPLPPGPQLQEDPEMDMRRMRQLQTIQLNSPGRTERISEDGPLVHLPVEWALQETAQNGELPSWEPLPEAEAVTETAEPAASSR